MTSTGTFKDTIKGRDKLSFIPSLFSYFLLLLFYLMFVNIWGLSRMTQKPRRHAAIADGRYEKKKQKEQEGRNRLDMALPILREQKPVSLKQMGKVTTVTV